MKPWIEISTELKKILAATPEINIAEQLSCEAAAHVHFRVSSYRKLTKIANKAVGDFIALVEKNDKSALSARVLMNSYGNLKSLPTDVVKAIREFGDEEVFKCFYALHKMLKEYISWFTEDVSLLDDLSVQCDTHKQAVSAIWRRVRTGEEHEHMDAIYALYELEIDMYIDNLRSKKKQEREAAAFSDAEEESKDSPQTDPSTSSTGKSFADAAKSNASEQKTNSPPKKWADYSSSDEELDQIGSLLGSFGRTNVASKPHIEIPKDFSIRFPVLYAAWERITKKWGWTIKESDCTFANEGFTGGDFGNASDAERDEILSKLKDEERINLNTLLSFLCSTLCRPEQISTTEQGNLVSGYVTSLFLQDKYKDDDKNMKLYRVSLKGSDAGHELIRSRIHGCFRTGSKCATTLFNVVIKMLARIIAKSSDEEKTDVCSRSDLCFTSFQGMMQNCYHTVSKRTVEHEQSTDKKGKAKKIRKTVTKIGKDVPHLSASGMEVNQSEGEDLRTKEDSFNRLNEIIAEILAKKQESRDPLKTAKVVKCVIDLAYYKIAPIRKLNKERKNAIRAKAQELAGEGKTLQASHWMLAKKELISSFEVISKETLSGLDWDVDKISKDLKLD